MSHFRTTIFFIGIVLLGLPCFADSAVLSVNPTTSTVTIGDMVTIEVDVSNVKDLYDYQFDLNFNPTILRAGSIAEGTFLSGAGTTFFIPGTIDNVGGSVSFNADTLLSAVSGKSGSGSLLDFTFVTVDPGISNLSLSNVILQDSTGAIIDNTLSGGAVTVGGESPIPEPSTVILLTTGLFGAVARRRLMA